MAFVYEDNKIESFAEFQDILDHDARLFDSNESLSDSVCYPHLIRSTERVLSKIKNSSWWKSATNPANAIVPEVNTDLIISRHNDFTDLTVYIALSEYILPYIADFGTQDNAEFNKMAYYANKASGIFEELINDGSWYDFNGDGSIQANEVKHGTILKRRVR